MTDQPMQPLDSKWWIERMLPDGYWLSLDDGDRVQECMRAMAESHAPPSRGLDRRETALVNKVRAKMQRITECQRQIEVIQAEIADALKVLEEAHAD
jgi:hypothetical protein